MHDTSKTAPDSRLVIHAQHLIDPPHWPAVRKVSLVPNYLRHRHSPTPRRPKTENRDGLAMDEEPPSCSIPSDDEIEEAFKRFLQHESWPSTRRAVHNRWLSAYYEDAPPDPRRQVLLLSEDGKVVLGYHNENNDEVWPREESWRLTTRIPRYLEPQLLTSVGGGSSGTGHLFTSTNCAFLRRTPSMRIQSRNKRRANESQNSMYLHTSGRLMVSWYSSRGQR